MPATSAKQFGFMAAVASGRARNAPKSLSRDEARKFLHETPASKRKAFAKQLRRVAAKRRQG